MEPKCIPRARTSCSSIVVRKSRAVVDISFAFTSSGKSCVRQRQVFRDVATFAAGLRDALREDPDLILVGEMRDPETISLALTAAETGHLVLSTIHARSTLSAIERIIDAYPEGRQQQIRGQLAESLRLAIAQRLVPNAKGNGRLPVVEVLRASAAVGNLIREDKLAQIPNVLQSGKAEGMLALERCLAQGVQAGDVRLADAQAVANDPHLLTTLLR
jgi:twitching motility protein PilT